MHPAIKQIIDLDIALAYVYSQVEQRPYGLFSYNEANPHHHSANMVRRVRTEDPEGAIAGIIAFYRAHRLTPRVKLNEMSEPADMAARLAAHGFTGEPLATRVMQWLGPAGQNDADRAIIIRRAGPSDQPALAQIGAEDDPSAQEGWFGRKLQAQLQHPAIRYYLASVGGQPAGCAYVFQGPEAGLIEDVATLTSFRRRGVATALITAIQNDATGPLLLEVIDEGAARVYARAGFHDCGEYRETLCWLAD
jgi:GNAT superfamily N-acetyltransferase